MKNFVSLLIIFFCLLSAGLVLAQVDVNEFTAEIAKKGGYDASADQYTLSETIGRIIKIALSLVGTIFFALTIYAGFLWMTASGNDEQVTKAMGILKMSIIGLVIVISAYSLTYFILASVTNATVDTGGGVSTPGRWTLFFKRFRLF